MFSGQCDSGDGGAQGGGDAHDDDVTSRLLRAAPMRLNAEHGISTFKKVAGFQNV